MKKSIKPIDKDDKVFNIILDSFEGPLDLLLRMVKDEKVDISKIQILPLADQYLMFLNKVIKKNIDIAGEYLVMGSVLAYIKSRSLLPKEDIIEDDEEILAEILKIQMKKLEIFQNLSKQLFSRKQLGKNFFQRGEEELFSKNIKFVYDLSLFNFVKVYSNLLNKDKLEKMVILESKLYTVDKAMDYLNSILNKINSWRDLSSFIPKEINKYLEIKSAFASYFVASLELNKEGKVLLTQNKNNIEIIKNNL